MFQYAYSIDYKAIFADKEMQSIVSKINKKQTDWEKTKTGYQLYKEIENTIYILILTP